MMPSLSLSMMPKASLNSWICFWENREKMFEPDFFAFFDPLLGWKGGDYQYDEKRRLSRSWKGETIKIMKRGDFQDHEKGRLSGWWKGEQLSDEIQVLCEILSFCETLQYLSYWELISWQIQFGQGYSTFLFQNHWSSGQTVEWARRSFACQSLVSGKYKQWIKTARRSWIRILPWKSLGKNKQRAAAGAG